MSDIKLNLSEENEIGFSLKIEGAQQDIADKPKIRFTLTEKSSGKGWIFPAKNNDENGIAITIPSMKGVIKENVQYTGKLEVVLGEHYFTPTVVDVEFVEPLKIEASMTTNKTKQKENILEESREIKSEENSFKIESAICEVKQPIQKEHVSEKQTINEDNKKISYSQLSKDDRDKVNKLFLEKCKNIDPVNMKTAKDVAHYMKEGTDYTKKRLAVLIGQSTKEYLENKS